MSIADKVHNARAIVTDLQQHGAAALDKFKGTPAQIEAYYEECLRIASQRGLSPVVVEPLKVAVAQIRAFVSADSAHLVP